MAHVPNSVHFPAGDLQSVEEHASRRANCFGEILIEDYAAIYGVANMTGMAGRVAIVTGGSRGIGAAITRRLSRAGARVVIGYSRNEEQARQQVAELMQVGGQAIAVQADVSDETQLERLFARTLEMYGRLDILVNNAGISGFRELEATNTAFYEEIFGVNVRGPLFAMRFAARHFSAEGGRIVNISSSITRSPTAQWAVYSASKAALEMMTACIAMELGPRGITVNAVAPGVTETEMLQQVIPADVQQQMAKATALRRLGKPDDIADVVAFLCSDEARWITGQTLIANGGLK